MFAAMRIGLCLPERQVIPMEATQLCSFTMISMSGGAYGVRELWQDAMHHPGCAQLKYLKDLMESVDFINGKADDSLLLFGQKERYHRISVFAGEDYILCYDYMGDEFLLDLRRFQNMALDAWWMDPRNNSISYITTIKGQEKWLASPVARKEKANDWVLILKKAD